nr:uncharacterized protein LOC117280665 [Nicotiana tomentosiformis]
MVAEDRPVRDVHNGRRLIYGFASRDDEDPPGTKRETSQLVEMAQPSSSPVHLGVPQSIVCPFRRRFHHHLSRRQQHVRRIILFRSQLRHCLLLAQRMPLLILLAFQAIMLQCILR